MKHFSIRVKMTLWITAALLLVAGLTLAATLGISGQMLQKTIRDNLIETVEHNVDEVEYFASLEAIYETQDVDSYIRYQEGYLEIDDDFLDEVNEVYTALYDSNGALLYGENPIAPESASLKLTNSRLQQITVNGTLYYVFDRALSAEGTQGLWLRGVVSESQGSLQISRITSLTLVLLPVLIVLAAGGGYLLARRALSPISQIADTARQIGQSGDLSRRITLGPGGDELHQLADSFNDMFDKLGRAFEAERQFTSDASHELRTPMAVISAECEYALERPLTEAEYQESLQVIHRQSRKMTRLIQDMLDFARLESASSRYEMAPLDLSALTQTLCQDMAFIRDKGITLTWETTDALMVYGNEALLSRLLSNLISNSYRYGKENGYIRVRAFARAGEAILSVEDDGAGIAPQEQEKIFRRFYQSDASRSGTGLGLGLSMASEIARFHHGRITVRSEVGRGSTFEVFLPLAEKI